MNMGFVGKAFSLNSFRCIASFKWAIRMISICSIRIRIQPMDDWRMGEICFSIGNCKQKLLLQFDATTKTRFSLKSKNNNNHSHSRATFPHLTWHFFFFLGSSLAFNENFTVYRNVFLRLVPSKLFDWFFFLSFYWVRVGLPNTYAQSFAILSFVVVVLLAWKSDAKICTSICIRRAQQYEFRILVKLFEKSNNELPVFLPINLNYHIFAHEWIVIHESHKKSNFVVYHSVHHHHNQYHCKVVTDKKKRHFRSSAAIISLFRITSRRHATPVIVLTSSR